MAIEEAEVERWIHGEAERLPDRADAGARALYVDVLDRDIFAVQSDELLASRAK